MLSLMENMSSPHILSPNELGNRVSKMNEERDKARGQCINKILAEFASRFNESIVYTTARNLPLHVMFSQHMNVLNT